MGDRFQPDLGPVARDVGLVDRAAAVDEVEGEVLDVADVFRPHREGLAVEHRLFRLLDVAVERIVRAEAFGQRRQRRGENGYAGKK